MTPVPWSQLSREEKQLRLVRSWRLAAPTLVTIATLLLMMLPLWMQGPILPQFGLLGVCYWAINRPNQMPAIAAFFIGLVQDMWLGMPLGVNATMLMLVTLVLAGQQLVFASRPFSFAWLMMIPVTLVYAIGSWILSALGGRPTQISLLLAQACLTLLLFPLATWLHARVQRKFVDPYLQDDV
jgi:rod shape-determining protein MreD